MTASARCWLDLSTAVDPGAAAERVRATILAAPVPEEVRQGVLQAYRDLGPDVAVAVRSSATAEDLAFASFAGQQDTYLNIIGGDAVVDAVRRCWASLWTDRAVDYRARNGIDQGSVRLAVVIQEMVQAATAGVLFTADPVTGTRHHSVIDASPGLGEAVVSGAVNPDRFVVDSANGEVLQRRIGDKRVLIRALTGGGVERVEQQGGEGLPSLSDQQITALTDLGQQVQDHYGSPQDIEWALDESGRLWLTQARPITTLYPLPDDVGGAGTRAYMCLSLAQGLTRPITPMGLAAFRLIATSVATAAGHPPADPLRGPAAYQVDRSAAVRRYHRGGAQPDRPPRHADRLRGDGGSRCGGHPRGSTSDPRFTLVDASPLRTLRPVARVLLGAGVPWRILLAALSPTRAYRAIDDGGGTVAPRARAAGRRHARATSRSCPAVSCPRVFLVMPTVIGYPLAGFLLLGLARRLLGDLARPGELQSILRGLPHNVTTEMDLELWELTERIRE